MNAEGGVNLQCRRRDVSGVISNVDRRQCVEYSSKYTTGVYWGIVGSGMGGRILGKVGKLHWAVLASVWGKAVGCEVECVLASGPWVNIGGQWVVGSGYWVLGTWAVGSGK